MATDWVRLTTNTGKDLFLRRTEIVSFVQYKKYIDQDNWHEAKIGMSNSEVHHVRQTCSSIADILDLEVANARDQRT